MKFRKRRKKRDAVRRKWWHNGQEHWTGNQETWHTIEILPKCLMRL